MRIALAMILALTPAFPLPADDALEGSAGNSECRSATLDAPMTPEEESKSGPRNPNILVLEELVKAGGVPDGVNAAAINAFVRQAIPEAGYMLEMPAEEISSTSAKVKSHHPIMLADNRILYLRLDDINPESVGKFAEECRAVAKMSVKPVGVALDLRSAGGSDLDSAAKLAAIFVPIADAILPQPLVVMVGGSTHGAAEALAAKLGRRGCSLSLGETTAGRPFPRLFIPLAAGGFLVMPQKSAGFAEVANTSLTPDISAAGEVIDYDKLAAEKGIEIKDPALSKSIDLLIGFHALEPDDER